MKAVRIHKYEGGPHDLIYEEDVTQPHAMGGEVLIKVYATGVTRNEIVWIWKNPGISLPLILGHEFSGLVEEVGSRVTNLRPGDAVFGLTDPSSVSRNGAEAEYVTAMDSEIAPKPHSLDHEYAAGVPMAGLTAWQHFSTMPICHQKIQYSSMVQLVAWVASRSNLPNDRCIYHRNGFGK